MGHGHSSSAGSTLTTHIVHGGNASSPGAASNSSTSSATGVAGFNTSGSQSAGVVGSISFGTPLASSSQTSVSASAVDAATAAQHTPQILPYSPTPPLQRRLAKSFSVAPTITQQKGAQKFLRTLLFFFFSLECVLCFFLYKILIFVNKST